MSALYINGEKYSGSLSLDIRVDQVLMNDSASIPSNAAVYKAYQELVTDMSKYDYDVVTSLPDKGVKGTIYLVPHEHGKTDRYDEYIWVSDIYGYEKIGNTDIDLSDYATKEELDEYTKTEDMVELTDDELANLWYNA